MKTFLRTFLASLLLAAIATAAEKQPMPDPTLLAPSEHHERLVMGGGCFWCMEAVFQRLKGVKKVVSGYAGGKVANPTYHQVCEGDTGHAEVVQIDFDPTVLPLSKLLEVFFAAHDPTTPNRQGHDIGTQYRSILFYNDDTQKAEIEKSKEAAQKDFKQPIVTQILPAQPFYAAEGYHQDYYNQNAAVNPYCSIVIRPKLEKLLKEGLIKE